MSAEQMQMELPQFHDHLQRTAGRAVTLQMKEDVVQFIAWRMGVVGTWADGVGVIHFDKFNNQEEGFTDDQD